MILETLWILSYNKEIKNSTNEKGEVWRVLLKASY